MSLMAKKFSIKWGQNVPGHISGTHGEILYEERRICHLNTWAFASCSCFSIQAFDGWYASEVLVDNVDAFFTFLNSSACEDLWLPNEIYFLLTDAQLNCPWARALTAHPNVRMRDKFSNKAHGGRIQHLFRYSSEKDFT